jgi:phosphatidyl-myo-inositol alpha-mannosyltransferase
VIGDRLRVGIAYDDSLDRPGGVAEYVTTLATELARRGHRAVLFTGQSDITEIHGVPVVSLAGNVGVRFNGNSLTMPLISHADEIARALQRECLDVLHVQMPYSPMMAGRLISRATPQTAVVGTFHLAADRPSTRAGARILARITRRSLGRFDGVMAVSGTAAKAARRTFGIDVDAIVPNMTSVQPGVKPRPRAPGTGERRLIVFLGRLVPRKGVDCLIDAAALLRREGVEADLIIAGDGPLRTGLEGQSKRLGLDGMITFLGQIEADERAPLLAAADLACFPAYHGESFGIVLVEAMTAGAGAVIGSRVPGYAEVLANDDHVLIEPENASALAHRLAVLLRDERLRTSIGLRQRRIADRYSSERVTSRVLAVYTEAMRSRQGVRRQDEMRAA